MNAATFEYGHIGPGLAHPLIAQAGLGDIDEKVRAGERLNHEDGVRLYETPSLASVGLMANRVRMARHGQRTYYHPIHAAPARLTNPVISSGTRTASAASVPPVFKSMRDMIDSNPTTAAIDPAPITASNAAITAA